jgi:uncharacterized protein (TIGR02145 family)
MTDQEGNVYKTIVIGTQEWMAENLNTSIYRNGDAIDTGLDNTTWSTTTSGAWAYYNNNPSYACPYGKLYNWHACTDSRGLCPADWHVPSTQDWNVLTEFLDGAFLAGGKMKSIGNLETTTGLWNYFNSESTNSSGFSGIPGGLRLSDGFYGSIYSSAFIWSSIEISPNESYYLLLDNFYADSFILFDIKRSGFSVRCLRD